MIWYFHIFCCFLCRKPPWILARVVNGGVGVDMHVASMHRLRAFMMFWKFVCAISHCVCVSWFCCSVLVRFNISRFCSSRKVVWRSWRFVGGMGYVMRGLVGEVFISLRTMLLVGS